LRRAALCVIGAAVFAVVFALAQPAHADHIRDMEYWLGQNQIRQAWQTTQGAGIKVAVIDTGIAGDVPDLRGAVIAGTDLSGLGSPDGQTPVGEGGESGHGTWVASMLAGRGTGGENGLIGVAPKASLLSVSVGFGVSAQRSSDAQIAQAIRWCVDHGASVINMSLTRNTLDWPPSWDAAFEYAFEHDVVVVAAAGNRGSGTDEVGAPATIPGVLTVAGVDRNGTASFDASSQGITIGVAAPSEQLVGARPGGGYVQWDGTSGAAPIVSGIVALVRAAYPDLDAANVINRIIQTATPVGRVPSPVYGYGIVDAARAVTAQVPHVEANPMGSLPDWVRLHRRGRMTQSAVPVETNAAPSPPTLAPEATVQAAGPDWQVATGTIIPLLLLGGVLVLATLLAGLTLRRFDRGGHKE
jgi:type VII secretion-associated serine protease mycosin